MNSIPSPTSAVSPRPYWLTEACPVWCVGGHRSDDEPGDRMHIPAWQGAVDLTLQAHTPRNLALFHDCRAGMPNTVMPAPYVQIHVSQNVGETHPRITVAVDDDPQRGFVATVDEIDDLIARLTEARDIANGSTPPANRP